MSLVTARPRSTCSGPDDAPALVWADGMSRGKIRRAMRIVPEQHTALLARWEDIHG